MKEPSELLMFLEIVKKRKIIIVLGVLLCFLSAVVATAYITPTYEATTQLLVSQGQAAPTNQTSGESYQAVLLSEKLTTTFSQMITGRTLAKKVIEKLKLPLSPDNLSKRVSAEAVRDTQLIQITVTDTDPVRAKNLADTYAKEFIKMVNKVIPASALINVSTVEPAATPHRPANPKPVLNAILGLLVGIMASIGFAFLLEQLDITVKEPDEIEQLTGLRSLGNIPDVKKPFLLNNNNSMVSEACRGIRTNLQYLNFDRSIKTFMVTSPSMSEGKTTTAANLAIVLAQAGFKVLVIDCDLRRPSIGKLFNQSAAAGLSNVLIGAARADSVILPTDIDGLSIMTSGPIPPNPADLLNSAWMDELISSLEKDYDQIILDSPPVLMMADSPILASKADAVLLVTNFGKTKKSTLAAAVDVLDKVGARLIGFAINKVQVTRGNSYYYYYKPYYKQQATINEKSA